MFLNVLLLSNHVSLKSSCTKKKKSVFLKANWLISIAVPTSLHAPWPVFPLKKITMLFTPLHCALCYAVLVYKSLFGHSHPLLWLSPAAPCCSWVAVWGWHSDALEVTWKDTELTACSKSFKSAFLLIFQSEKQTLQHAWSRLFKAVKKIGIRALSRNYLEYIKL